jgi:D-lactate dehydrogenase
MAAADILDLNRRSPMKIAIFEVEPWEGDAFSTLRGEHELVLVREPLRQANAERHADAECISTFIYSELGSDVLQYFSQLKLIATRSTGVDHIDTAYCRQQGVAVCNVPSYGEHTVAEHVFGLLLTISHRLTEAIDRTRKGDFSQQGLQGFDLRGKTLGVIGTGAIGRCVIEIAKGFRMQVVAYDLKPDETFASHMGFRYASLDDVLSTADVLTLHVPATRATHHLLSGEQFARMKDGMVLINTARGSLVDVRALVQALAEGKVAAAGLDVLPDEPVIREEAELLRSLFREQHDLQTLLANHILLRLRHVYVTPHSAFNTREAVGRIITTTVDNIRAFAHGEPRNLVR